MKIIFFNPYYSFYGDTYVFYRANVPYGLVSIASYLQEHGVVSKIYELGIFNEKDVKDIGGRKRCGVYDEEIVDILRMEQPDIIGISTMYTVFHDDYVELIELIKRHCPYARIVVGGNHASSFPEKMLDGGADQVVMGEGEEAMLAIANGEKSRVVHRPFIESLDSLPLPDYSFIEFERYIEVNNPFSMRMPVAGMQTSRGCPMDCCYCSANGVWQRVWRAKSPWNVVNEMSMLVDLWGVREIHFLDDNIAVNKDRLKNICREIIKRKLNVKWATPNGIPYWLLDEETLDLMKESGCYRLTFGIESGDPKVRNYIGKNFSLQKAEEVISYANRIGIWTVTTNIIGFPYETGEQVQRTINFAKDCGTDFACFFTLLPHASSRVYQDFLREGLIDHEDAMSALNEGGTPTTVFTKEEIKELQRLAYHEFTKHKMRVYIKDPVLLLKKVHSFEDLKYLFKVIKMGIGMKKKQGQQIKTSKDFIYGKKQYV